MIKFFYSKGSVSYAAHILLEELGIKYQAIQLNLKKNDQKKKKYLKLNPKGRVPLIITQYGSISETPAILYFISQMYPKKNLCPKNPYKFAQALSFNCYISSTIHVAYAHKIRGNRWVDDELSINKMKKKVTQNMRKYAKTLEKYYIKGPWVMG